MQSLEQQHLPGTLVSAHPLGGQRDPEAITHQHCYQAHSSVLCHKTKRCSQQTLLTPILLLLQTKIHLRGKNRTACRAGLISPHLARTQRDPTWSQVRHCIAQVCTDGLVYLHRFQSVCYSDQRHSKEDALTITEGLSKWADNKTPT